MYFAEYPEKDRILPWAAYSQELMEYGEEDKVRESKGRIFIRLSLVTCSLSLAPEGNDDELLCWECSEKSVLRRDEVAACRYKQAFQQRGQSFGNGIIVKLGSCWGPESCCSSIRSFPLGQHCCYSSACSKLDKRPPERSFEWARWPWVDCWL